MTKHYPALSLLYLTFLPSRFYFLPELLLSFLSILTLSLYFKILQTIAFGALIFLFLLVSTLCFLSITILSSMPRISLKSVSSSFSQSYNASSDLSLMPSIIKVFRPSWSLRSISLSSAKAASSWLLHIFTRLSMFPKFSSTLATLSSKTFPVCSMVRLSSLTSFFSLTISCFKISRLSLLRNGKIVWTHGPYLAELWY